MGGFDEGVKGSLFAFGRNGRHRFAFENCVANEQRPPCEAACKVTALLMAAAPTENIAKIIGLTAARDGGANSLNAAHLRASSAQTTPNQSRQVTEKLKIPLKQSGRSRP
jgi:hypothetical protein